MIQFETLKSFCGKPEFNMESQAYAVRISKWWWATDRHALIAVPFTKCKHGDKRFQKDEIPENVGKFPNVLGLVNPEKFQPKGKLSVEHLREALNKIPMTEELEEVESPLNYIKCPCCKNGEIEITRSLKYNGRYYEAEAVAECPICHGYSKIPDFDDYNPLEMEYNPSTDNTYKHNIPSGRMCPDYSNTVLKIGEIYIIPKEIERLLKVVEDMGVTEIEHGDIGYPQPLACMIDGVFVYMMNIFVPLDDNTITTNIVEVELT